MAGIDLRGPAGTTNAASLDYTTTPSAATATGAPGTSLQGSPSDHAHPTNTIGASAIYGDGSDGAVVLDGTNTYSFISKAGSVYTLNRDVMLSSLTVATGVLLFTGGCAIYNTGTTTVATGAEIANGFSTVFGGNPSAGQGTTSQTASTRGVGGTGVGAAGPSMGNSVGGAGGAGGTGASGAGGAGGTVTPPSTNQGAWRLVSVALNKMVTFSARQGMTQLTLGAGGGAGAGDGTNVGGNGGTPGGIVLLLTRTLTINGIISAAGQAGSQPNAGNAGGGGGGGGGCVFLVYNTKTGSGSITAAGGAAGAGRGTGTAGGAGSTGTVVELVNS